MSRNFTQLLAWRWVTGVGSALQMSGSQLYLADISLSSNRARTLGTNQVCRIHFSCAYFVESCQCMPDDSINAKVRVRACSESCYALWLPKQVPCAERSHLRVIISPVCWVPVARNSP